MDFFELTALLEHLPVFDLPAVDCAVTLEGRPVYRHTVGYADVDAKTPLTEENTYRLYSASKVSTCLGALLLVERGMMELDDPVAKYLPEFGSVAVREEDGTVRPAKTVMTLRHLFSMTGGLDYDLETEEIRAAVEATGGRAPTREMMKAIAKKPLSFDPGTKYQYSLCHDVLGAVIEVVSGMRFGAFLEENIFAPLGMKDTTFHPTEAQLQRMAWQYYNYDHRTNTYDDRSKDNRFIFGTEYESGGAGLVSTVNDYIRLGTMMCLGGISPEGVRICKPETLELMRTDQMDENTFPGVFDKLTWQGYSYGLGVRTRVREMGKCLAPVGEFGWDGAMGAYLVIDPVNHLSIFYAQHESGHPWHHEAIRDAVYRSLKR